MSSRNKIIISFLSLLIFSGIGCLAQNTADVKGNTDFPVLVSTLPEDAEGSIALVPVMGIDVNLYLSDGNSVHKVSTFDGMAIFKGLPIGCEYVAVLSAKGYSTAVYHGKVSNRPGFPTELYVTRDSSSRKRPAFKYPGKADVEGFVTCPASWQWVSTPLPDASVIYTSSSDSLCTKSDKYGYFSFNGVKDKNGKVSVSHESYKKADAVISPDGGSRWLWLATRPE